MRPYAPARFLMMLPLLAMGVALFVPMSAHAQTKIYLTSTTTTSWTVPSDWNSEDNTIEAIGGGGRGGYAPDEPGGGGGAYARISNLDLTPNASVSYQVGAGGGTHTYDWGISTWFESYSTVLAAAGMQGADFDGRGGQASGSVGDVIHEGGWGLSGDGPGGGGGAAGPSGDGKDGSGGYLSNSPDYDHFRLGGGGGGANGGDSTDSDYYSYTVGAGYIKAMDGGQGSSGAGGGTGAIWDQLFGFTEAVPGTGGGGGGGGLGSDTNSPAASDGANGGSDTSLGSSYGSGGGGGGGGCSIQCYLFSGMGGEGGLYGGGGGNPGGKGAQGIVVITYEPIPPPPTCTLTASHPTLPQGGTSLLEWTTTDADTASIDQGIGSVSTSPDTEDAAPSVTTTYTMTVTNSEGSDTCSATVTITSEKIIFLTSGSSWTVPDDWNSGDNSIEVIGSGGSDPAGGATGGGAYALKNNLALVSGASVAYQVGNTQFGTNDGDTWFSSIVTVLGKSGGSTNGGSAGSSVGDVKYSGGNGTHAGGGAGGPGGAGQNNSSNVGGAGGAGLGGVGGTGFVGTGQNGTEFDALHGSGGGGGASISACAGAGGGSYGGGAACSADGGSGLGGPGLIVITYLPAEPMPPTCTLTASHPTLPQGGTSLIEWTTTDADSASIDQGIGSVSPVPGTEDAAPSVTTTYTMTVTNDLGSDTCSATVTITAEKIVFLTSGSSWTVPDDWNSGDNSIEVIGAGGSTAGGSGRAGGGAYARKNSLALSPGNSVSYQVGDASTYVEGDGDTWFSSTSIVLARQGEVGNFAAGGGAGGPASTSVGDVKYSGGRGGAGEGEGGGGAAGPNGAGGNSSDASGGTGGNGLGGTGGISSGGGNGTEFDAYHGSGGGGAGGYGAGNFGGGPGANPEGDVGAPGLIVITYLPLTLSCSISADPSSVEEGSPTTLTWTSFGAVSASIDNSIGSVATSSSTVVSPATTTTYILTVSDGSTTEDCEVTVTTYPPPPPSCMLGANPNGVIQGGSTTLSWTTENSTSASIDNGIGSVATTSGSTNVTVSSPTTYTMSVSGPGGAYSCMASVSVTTSKFMIFGGSTTIEGGSVIVQ